MVEVDQPHDRAPKGSGPRGGGQPLRRCAVCGGEFARRNTVRLDAVRPVLAEFIAERHPEAGPDAVVCRKDLARLRADYVRELLSQERGEITRLDAQVIASLAAGDTVAQDLDRAFAGRRSLGERLSDGLADFGGSWSFLILFAVLLAVWIAFNLVTLGEARFDPYPFILLNLLLSCVAAVQAPIIMMSQKRLEARDRLRAENDYKVNLKAELEIRHLHEKLDHLLTQQWDRLAEIQEIQIELMESLTGRRR